MKNTYLVLPRMHNVLTSSKSGEEMVLTVVEEMTSVKKPKAIPEPKYEPNEPNKKSEILLVDDSPTMREFYRSMLEKNSFCVCTAAEDESAIDYATHNRPRLVLIDDAGRASKAVRIARSLRNDIRTKGIPLLLMLPADIFRRMHRKVSLYVDMCIPKTFTSAVLMSSIQSLLSS